MNKVAYFMQVFIVTHIAIFVENSRGRKYRSRKKNPCKNLLIIVSKERRRYDVIQAKKDKLKKKKNWSNVQIKMKTNKLHTLHSINAQSGWTKHRSEWTNEQVSSGIFCNVMEKAQNEAQMKTKYSKGMRENRQWCERCAAHGEVKYMSCMCYGF